MAVEVAKRPSCPSHFESEWDSTANFGVNSLGWIRLFCPDFDFIWPYFDLISLVLQLSSCWIYVLNFARNCWILSEFYSQIWVDFSTKKRTLQEDFDFIWAYFNLISLALQLFLSILQFIWDSYWVRRTIRAWRSLHHLNSQSRDFYWCWLNRLLVLLYLIHSDWFILIYLIDFVDFHWYFEAGRLTVPANLGGCVAFTQ